MPARIASERKVRRENEGRLSVPLGGGEPFIAVLADAVFVARGFFELRPHGAKIVSG